jgi:hypothetical protein
MESMRLPNVPLEPGLYPEAVTPHRKPHDALRRHDISRAAMKSRRRRSSQMSNS